MIEHQPDHLDQALGLAIRLRRHTAGLSQSGLGNAIGVTFQQIQKYERGHNRVSFSMLVRICQTLGCSVADLVAEVEQIGPGEGRVQQVLAQPEAGPMLEALAAIRSAGARRAVLELARGLASEAA